MSAIPSFLQNNLVLALVALAVGGVLGGVVVTWQADTTEASSHAEHAASASDSTDAAEAQQRPSQSSSGLAAYDENGDGVVYQGGMHPDIVRDEPGKCPICGMQLTPVQVGGNREKGTVRVSAATMQNIGVRTAPVEVRPLSRRVRTTGRFEANAQRMTAVSPKVSGWVDRLYVDYEGARVQAGQPVFDIYSPQLVATQEEYLSAVRSAERLGDDPGSQRLVEAARRRLAYWDVTDAQIDRLRETGEPTRTVTFYAPRGGTITRLNVTEGEKISAGQTVLHVTPLNTLWLMVGVYEQDLAWVDVGTEAEIQLPYDPGTSLTGTVGYLYDEVDPNTRTLRARISVSNPDRRLKPGMYATVTLSGGQADPMPLVPEAAIVSSGERDVVIVALGGGRFRPVPVTAGLTSGGRTQVLRGLDGGETIVTSAQFLIDSEARLQGALDAMTSGGHSHGESQRSGTSDTPEQHSPEQHSPDEHLQDEPSHEGHTHDAASRGDANASESTSHSHHH